MSNLLNFCQVWAFWRDVPKNVLDAMVEWITKNQLLPNQVRVNGVESVISARCKIGEDLMLGPSVTLIELPYPDCFRISISEAENGPAIAVVNNQGKALGGTEEKEKQTGERLLIHPFLKGTVVRCWRLRDGSHKVDAHYMGVQKKGQELYLEVALRLDVSIPRFSGPKDLEGFFRDNKVPEYLQDIVTAMVGFSRRDGKVYDPKWDGALANLRKSEPTGEPVGSDKPATEFEASDEESKASEGKPAGSGKKSRPKGKGKGRPKTEDPKLPRDITNLAEAQAAQEEGRLES